MANVELHARFPARVRVVRASRFGGGFRADRRNKRSYLLKYVKPTTPLHFIADDNIIRLRLQVEGEVWFVDRDGRFNRAQRCGILPEPAILRLNGLVYAQTPPSERLLGPP